LFYSTPPKYPAVEPIKFTFGTIGGRKNKRKDSNFKARLGKIGL